ncbi:CheR family methyltransferase [Novosphingobium decolorationis]|uniref:Protein-glutamate O-methyltransferase CheR n=1 Tax=Novosphingobium decolorationis TaxID=2698673 RepID=A0ABX8E955_9SPHN|nr:CheR family methyltransferase [Novosphingobium decolorationis]QVM85712.1 protein-glutamate O-methyltransferase CheR [Novosphingobium decolorationis]
MMNMRSEDTLEDIELDLLIEAIWRRYQYDFRDYSRTSVLRRLQRAQAHFGHANLSGLLDQILHEPECLPELIGFLTIQVSDMFRDPDYFRTIREKVVPHLRTWPSIKVWIAGCANGEEFYSLAILFREEGLEDRTLFYCTDINTAALERAKAGIFEIDRLPGFSRNYREAGGKGSLSDYYTANYGVARFAPTLRSRVVFADHNLASDAVFSEVHFVSSRNVLIYFDRALQDRALGLFARSLPPGGFLGLGSKETVLFSPERENFADFAPDEKVWRRRAHSSQEAVYAE